MKKYNVYQDLPKEPSAPLEPQSYHLNVIHSKREGLLKLEEGIQRNTPSTPKYWINWYG